MNSPLPTILLWIFAVWLMGWLMLPVGRTVFRNLPDGGLTAGRVLLVALATLAAFWGASLHLLPLAFSPVFLIGLPLLACVLTLRHPLARAEFVAWVREQRVNLLVSELIFLAAFFFFGWIRWRHPELNEFEKPMDAMLLSGLSQARFLPMDNPWLAGTPFTSYYYFGPLMGSVLTRTFATPAPLAYNLVQPLFCAFFVATLWSICAALTRSPWRGFIAMSAVALLGHFEPLRQIAQGGIAKNGQWWPFDWWSTSRVVENTINEYPFFTLALGDAHAHFYALSLAALFFCLCYALFAGAAPPVPVEEPPVPAPRKGKKGKKAAAEVVEAPVVVEEMPVIESIVPLLQRVRFVLLGTLLGIIVLTNTWDAPLYLLVALACGFLAAPKIIRFKAPMLEWAVVLVLLAPIVAFPYLRLFKAPVSGIEFEFWLPPLLSFALLWGVFLLLGLFNLLGSLLVKRGTLVKRGAAVDGEPADGKRDPAPAFFAVLLICGLLALVAPMFFYLNGKFGGDLRHQDTVFKFWLQAWVLLGTALACGVLRLQAALPRVGRAILSGLLVVVWFVPLLSSYSVTWDRAVRDASRDIDGKPVFALDGARFLPPDDRKAIDWLRVNARPGDVVLEATNPTSFYSYVIFGRVATFSGMPTVLGWSQHVWLWGADLGNEAEPRWNAINDIYAWRDSVAALSELDQRHVSYVFVGEEERKRYDPAGLQRLKENLKVVYSSGDTFIAAVAKEEDGAP